jgi:plasmid stabilization system protein ParE
MDIAFHPRARDELLEAEDCYQARSSLSAVAFRREIAKAIRMIADNPLWYSPGEGGTRRFILPKFPFSVVYRVGAGHSKTPDLTGADILIVAVAHHKRRPGYWLNR